MVSLRHHSRRSGCPGYQRHRPSRGQRATSSYIPNQDHRRQAI
ncbi:hypothetical protein THAR02_07474, partial [Trichoderma harzianum]